MFIALSQPPFNCVLAVSIKKDIFIPPLSEVTVQSKYFINNVDGETELGFSFTFY